MRLAIEFTVLFLQPTRLGRWVTEGCTDLMAHNLGDEGPWLVLPVNQMKMNNTDISRHPT